MLNLSYSDIANWESVCLMDDPDNSEGKQIENPWNFTMGVYMMHTGIGKLTASNADEFYMRAKLIDACFDGGLMRGPKGEVLGITPERVHAYIGLGSNVSRWTQVQFFKHLREDVIRNLMQHYHYIAKQLDAKTTTTV